MLAWAKGLNEFPKLSFEDRNPFATVMVDEALCDWRIHRPRKKGDRTHQPSRCSTDSCILPQGRSRSSAAEQQSGAGMPESEILLTMAEVAVAFAGFTALASVFSGRRTRDHPRQSAVLLRGMIEASLFVVLFALLPLVLERTPLESASIWRVSSAACAACWLGVGALFIRDGLKLKRELGLRVNPWYAAPSLANLILGNAMFLLTATGVISSWAGGAYTVGLLCLLANSAISFARFFFGAYEKLAD